MRRRPAAAWLAALLVVVAACSAGPGGGAAAPAATASDRAPAAPTASDEPTAAPAASAEPTAAPAATPSPPQPSAVASDRASPVARASRWARLDANGPAAREDHTWTVTPDGGAWLFGGRDGGTVFGDVWRYDLATDSWEQVEVGGAAPAARFGHTATWIDGVGIVVWSGQAGATFYDDIWAFDPAGRAWRELPAPGPVPAARYGSCAALGPDGRLWVSHGFTADAGRFSDTWAYDFGAGGWTEVATQGDVPVIRCLHDCLFTPDGRFVIYAGQTTGVPAIGDLWARPVDGSWARAPEPPPPARQLYALATRDSTAWIFGGGGEDRGKLGDLWSLDLGTLAWAEVGVDGESPAARSGSTLVDDASASRLLLFGGQTEDGASAETWALELGG